MEQPNISLQENLQDKFDPTFWGGYRAFKHYKYTGKNSIEEVNLLDPDLVIDVWNFGNTSYTHWVKGECITWDWMHMPHGTANMCMNTRYSLHLTGYMTESSWKFFKEGTPRTQYTWNNETQTFEKIHNQPPIIPR